MLIPGAPKGTTDRIARPQPKKPVAVNAHGPGSGAPPTAPIGPRPISPPGFPPLGGPVSPPGPGNAPPRGPISPPGPPNLPPGSSGPLSPPGPGNRPPGPVGPISPPGPPNRPPLPPQDGGAIARQLEQARSGGSLATLIGHEDAANWGNQAFSSNIDDLYAQFGTGDIQALLGLQQLGDGGDPTLDPRFRKDMGSGPALQGLTRTRY